MRLVGRSFGFGGPTARLSRGDRPAQFAATEKLANALVCDSQFGWRVIIIFRAYSGVFFMPKQSSRSTLAKIKKLVDSALDLLDKKKKKTRPKKKKK